MGYGNRIWLLRLFALDWVLEPLRLPACLWPPLRPRRLSNIGYPLLSGLSCTTSSLIVSDNSTSKFPLGPSHTYVSNDRSFSLHAHAMRLLKTDTLEIVEFLDPSVIEGKHAVLSHTWED